MASGRFQDSARVIVAAEGVRPAVRFAVALAAQADKVAASIGLCWRFVCLEPLNVMHMKGGTAMLAAFLTASVLCLDNLQPQNAPAGAAIVAVASGPILRSGAGIGSLVIEMALDAAEPRRVAAVYGSPLNLVGLQAERLRALSAREHDRLFPFRVSPAGASLGSKPSSGVSWRSSVRGLRSNGRLTQARSGAILRAVDKASLNEHLCAAMSAEFPNSRIAHALIIAARGI